MNGSLLYPLSQPFAKMVRPPHRCSGAVFWIFFASETALSRACLSRLPHRLGWIVTKPLPPRPLFRGPQPRKTFWIYPRSRRVEVSTTGRGRRLKSGEIPAHGGQFPVRRSKFPARVNKFPVRRELIPCFIL